MSERESLSVDDLKDIQAGPVVPIPTRNTTFLFFSIKDVIKFRDLFRTHVLPLITTADMARRMREEVFRAKLKSEMVTLAGVNVSFSQHGLSAFLGHDADAKDEAFKEGQKSRAKSLGDNAANWLAVFKDKPIHGMFEITGYPASHIQTVVEEGIKRPLGDSIDIVFEHHSQVRPGNQKGHEHFGFNDGISQPFVKFQDDNEQVPKRVHFPGQTVVNPGVLIMGHHGDEETRPSWAKNGSFVVYRHLKQLVPEFNKFLKDTVLASVIRVGPYSPGPMDSTDLQKRIDYLGARLVGRWKSGLPVVLTEKKPGEFPVDNPVIGKDPNLNNLFNYGPREESPRKQLLCPFAGHTRKTGPRTDIPQDDVEKRAIRRGGNTFGPELSAGEEHRTIHERGLSFVCYQSSVVGGFEFIQKNWSNNLNFPFNTGGVQPGIDPIVGQNETRKMTGYDAEDLSKELPIPDDFIISQGGEYFFLPSITTLRGNL